MNIDIAISRWHVYVLDRKDRDGWVAPTHVAAYGVESAVKTATSHLPDGTYPLFVVCLDDNEAHNARVTINREPVVTVELV